MPADRHPTSSLVRAARGALPLSLLLVLGCGVEGAGEPQGGLGESSAPLSLQRDGTLAWPRELPAPLAPAATLYETPAANYVLDFHGDPGKSDLVVFMAGNQYMVLPDLIAAFKEWYPAYADAAGLQKRAIKEVFYATTPPGVLIRAMDSGQLAIGNLTLSVDRNELWPDVFMTGARQQRTLYQKGYTANYYPYTSNRGVGLLVRDGNPRGIGGVMDLARDDVAVAISSPTREPASYESYGRVIDAQSAGLWTGTQPLSAYLLTKPTTISPLYVHHRENPQLIADGTADVAPMYFHFGLYLESVFPDVFDFVPLPAAGNEYASMGMARILTARHPETADAWMEFLRTDIARDIYAAHGFDYATAQQLATPIVPQ